MPAPTPRAANIIPTTPPEIRILSATVTAGAETVIVWSAESGKTYRLQFKDDLNEADWTDLTEISATGSTASATSFVGPIPQRFYRIQLLNP
jgi:hypothetical protein